MTYEEQHAALVTYLKVKTEQADWHAVNDAANDLRVLEAARLHNTVWKSALGPKGWELFRY